MTSAISGQAIQKNERHTSAVRRAVQAGRRLTHSTLRIRLACRVSLGPACLLPAEENGGGYRRLNGGKEGRGGKEEEKEKKGGRILMALFFPFQIGGPDLSSHEAAW